MSLPEGVIGLENEIKVGKGNKRKKSQVKMKVSSPVDWTGILAQVQDEK